MKVKITPEAFATAATNAAGTAANTNAANTNTTTTAASAAAQLNSFNRKDRRKLMKLYGLTMKELNNILTPTVVIEKLPDHSKVKLNYDRIMEEDRVSAYSDLYIKFVEDHKDQILTCYQDESHKDSNLYCLEEDDGAPEAKWLFDISDLELQLDLDEVDVVPDTDFATAKAAAEAMEEDSIADSTADTTAK